MDRPRVLVTRPQPGAARTAERLLALGFDPVVMPLTETVALAHGTPEALPDFVVATSPQAFRHLSAPALATLSTIRVRATGRATAAAAREAGFLDVKETGGDIIRLMSSLSQILKPGISILYLAGRVRRPELEQNLADKGVDLSITEVYDTIQVSYSTENIRALSADGELSAVLLTSVNCATQLAKIVHSAEHFQAIDNALLICLSQRIADTAEQMFPNPVKVAFAPTEDALLECLVAALSQV